MCGIVGYSGKRSAQEVLLNGLEKLEYRGYDSAGVALALEGGIHVVKSKGRLEVLRRKLEAESLPESFCGIGPSPFPRTLPCVSATGSFLSGCWPRGQWSGWNGNSAPA